VYTQSELSQVRSLKKRRTLIAVIPAAILLAAGIVLFVLGRIDRSDSMWKITAAFTVAGLFYLFFMLGVYVVPVYKYEKHVDRMLNGWQHLCTGILKEVSDNVCEKEGVLFHPIMINVGEKNDGKDDRLYYFDVLKELPQIPLGERITIQHNDIMVSDFYRAE